MKKVIMVLLVLFVCVGLAFAGEKARDGRFIAYDDGTVRDTRTGLLWAASDNGSNVNWHFAKKYVDGYRGGGWRMPTQDELAGLYDSSITDSGLLHKTKLIGLTGGGCWASETRGSEAAAFSFHLGNRFWSAQSYNHVMRALPVRR